MPRPGGVGFKNAQDAQDAQLLPSDGDGRSGGDSDGVETGDFGACRGDPPPSPLGGGMVGLLLPYSPPTLPHSEGDTDDTDDEDGRGLNFGDMAGRGR